jgi:hypothetical protein
MNGSYKEAWRCSDRVAHLTADPIVLVPLAVQGKPVTPAMNPLATDDTSAVIPMPFAPVCAAAALWRTTPQAAMSSSVLVPGAGALVPPTRQQDPCQLGVITLGGPLAPGDNDVCYDPRKVRLAAPPMPDIPRGPKTQYAPEGPAIMHALDIGFGPLGPCVCRGPGCPCFVPTSLAGLLVTVRNGIRVQRALAAAGVINVAGWLAAAPETVLPCFCTALGRDVDLTAAFFTFADSFSDTAVVTLQDPPQYVQYLNTVFVQQTLGSIQHQVVTAAAINYARAEPNTAYLTPRPSTVDSVFNRTANYDLAALRAQQWALSDPLSTPQRRADLAAVTGLPIGGAPCPPWPR